MYSAAAAQSLQSCPTLCDPIDGGPPGSPVPGSLQARTLEWVVISFSNAWKGKVKVGQSSLTLCDPMVYTVHGILQARILEWVAFPFSVGSSQPRDQTQVSLIAGRFFSSWATREAQKRVVWLHVNPLKSEERRVRVSNLNETWVVGSHASAKGWGLAEVLWKFHVYKGALVRDLFEKVETSLEGGAISPL